MKGSSFWTGVAALALVLIMAVLASTALAEKRWGHPPLSQADGPGSATATLS
jgi:hypothetical protein